MDIPLNSEESKESKESKDNKDNKESRKDPLDDSQQNLEWGNIPNNRDDEPENISDTIDEGRNTILKGDQYIMLLKTKEKPILCVVEAINEEDKTIEFSNKTKNYIVNYDSNYTILLETKDYEILEIIKVKKFDLDLDEYTKLKEIEFETITKSDFEKEYSEIILIDDL